MSLVTVGPAPDSPRESTRFEPLSSREIWRVLRSPSVVASTLPESDFWQAFVELGRRGESGAAPFVAALKGLHRDRSFARGKAALVDPAPEEHRLAGDPYLGELWKSYKRCVCAGRFGPAGQLLREIEKQLGL